MIYLGMSPWRSMWKNRHQLMSRFAAQLPVLYVERPVYLRWLLRKGLWSGGLWRGLTTPTVRREAGLTIMCRPYRLPVSGDDRLGRLLRRRWLSAIRRAARRAGIERPILWISQPDQGFAVDALGADLSIYHVVDEYAGYTSIDGAPRTELARKERDVLDAVDLVIVVSDELAAAKSGPGRSVHLVENAVDLAAYTGARRDRRTPSDLAGIPAPRLGYSGLIGKRLDLDLLAGLAKARPDWSLVFVGRVDPTACESEMTALEALPNVHFLGERPAGDVPRYVVEFDVGLLPYAINQETVHISPLKMYEYLGAGLPIVSTDIPAARRMGHLVSIAGRPEEFVTACDRALEDDSAESVAARIEAASENTWDQRVAQIAALTRRQLAI
jgi:glycosyltransferase involved in cell wall biosynthesis